MKKIKNLFQFFKEKVIEGGGAEVPHDSIVTAFVDVVMGRFGEMLTVYDDVEYKKFLKKIATLTDADRELLQTRMDDLYDERKRRIAGQFYTPVEFVELAHSLMDHRLGTDWRENFVVWDASAGSLNLTRGHKFRELYSSTLQQEEVERNPVSDPTTETFFQFDFLNGDFSKLPVGLKNALEANRPILFFMNPPYSTGGMEKSKFGSKTRVVTQVQVQSRRMGLSTSAKDLYCQFMIRIMLLVQQYKLTNVVYAVFSPLTFLSSDNLKPFRKRWCDMFQFDRGVMFDAGHFSGTSLNWAIQFSIWKPGKSEKTSGFKYFVIEKDENGVPVKTGTKFVHNLDIPHSEYQRLSPDWLATPMTAPTKFMPGVNTAFELVNSVKNGYDATNRVSADHLGKLCYDSALTVYSAGNNHGRPGININTTTVGNLEITPYNFERVMAFVAVARSLENTFIDQKDYFYLPNTEHPQWEQFVVDSVIFGLFCNGSAHISRYDVEWYGQQYQIPNEFFWMPMDWMAGVAQLHENEKTLHTLEIQPEERFVCQWLEWQFPIEEIASAEAMALILKGTNLLMATFQHREEFDKKRPEIQICNWDAGWWQLKVLWHAVAKEEFAELVALREELRRSLQKRIRLFGWLRPRNMP